MSVMLRASLVFFILGVLALSLGASGLAGLSIELGRTILFIFLLFAVVSFIFSLRERNAPRAGKLP